MEASELRIGNWVHLYRIPSDKEMTHYQVEEISYWPYDDCDYGVNVDGGFLVNIKTGIEPVPLTEEWLLKFGFEITWIIDHPDEYFPMLKSSTGYYFSPDQHHWTGIEIKYVHQLQNLFFAITGSELKTTRTNLISP